MKLNVETTTETATGLMDDIEYSFEAGAHMMQILSGLYTNPEVAVVREYLTNMYDAHIALHRATGSWGPKPTITLPTTLSPTLIFADKGIGMSAESVKGIYTRYGKSTKSNSNDEVGGFGLGAKVAFAYNGGVDWTVTSVFNGEKNSFIARVGTNGMPVLSHLDSTPTDEPNGTTVTIPIRRQDIGTIQTTAKKYLHYFPLPINIENATFTMTPRVAELSGTNWSVAGRGGDGYMGLTVVVGNVPYTVPEGEYRDAVTKAKVVDTTTNNGYYFWTQNEFVINLPVGSVDIVPSRDSVKFTDKTRATIADAIVTVNKEIRQEISKQVANAPTEYDALVMLDKISNLSYINELTQSADYKGKRISRLEGITRDVTDFPDTTFSAFGITKTDDGEVVEIDCTKTVNVKVDMRSTQVLFVDVPKNEARIAKALAHNLLVSKTKGGRASRWGGHKVGHILLVRTKLTPEEFCKLFGGLPVDRIGLTSQHVKERAPAGTGINEENIYRFNGRSWEARVKIPSDGTVRYYLPLTKGYARFSYQDDHNVVQNMEREARYLGVIPSDYTSNIYGIKADEVAKFDKKEWADLRDALVAAVAAEIPKRAQAIALWKRYGSWTPSGMWAITNAFMFVAPIAAWRTLHGTHEKMFSDAAEFLKVTDRFRNEPAVKKALDAVPAFKGATIHEEWNKLVVAYPLLTLAVECGRASISTYAPNNDATVNRYRVVIEQYVKGLTPTP